MEKFYFDAQDVQRVTGLSRSTVYTLFHAEDFPSIRIGRRLLVHVDALGQWMDAQRNRDTDEKRA